MSRRLRLIVNCLFFISYNDYSLRYIQMFVVMHTAWQPTRKSGEVIKFDFENDEVDVEKHVRDGT